MAELVATEGQRLMRRLERLVHAVLKGDLEFGRPLTQIRPDRPVVLDPKDGEAKYVYTPGRTAKRLGTNLLARDLPTWDDLTPYSCS